MKSSTKIHRAVVETLEARRLLSFGAPVYYTAGAPTTLATADLNGDGRRDLVAASPSSNNVGVLLGNANGTLQPVQTYPTGAGPHSVAVGDFDGDGNTDVATTNTTNASVLLGSANGALQAPRSIALPGQLPPDYTGGTPIAQSLLSIAAGDVNADGKLDLAVTGRTTFRVSFPGYYGYYYQDVTNDYVNILLGDGHGDFAPATATLNNGNYNYSGSMTLADFNGDHKLDVMTTNSYDTSVLLGNGTGALQAPIRSVPSSTGVAAVGDIDNDGKLDIITSYAVFKGRGDGTFQSSTNLGIGYVRSLVLGDVNADGKLDMVANTSETHFTSYGYYGGYNPITTDYVKVLLGYGDGSFALPISSTLATYPGYGGSPNISVLGDINGDGSPDLAAAEYSTGVSLQLNQANWILPAVVRIGDVTVNEGNSGTIDAVFTVSVEHRGNQSLTVNYTTADGDATLVDTDYQAASGTLVFAAGETSKTITVKVNGDRIGENDESFYVHLTGATNADILDGSGMGTIVDNEPSFSIDDASLTEGDSGTKLMTFTASLSAAYDQSVTVNYNTADGSATLAGGDFQAASGTLVFAAGEISKTFTVKVNGDRIGEYEEYFYVSLTGATNADILDGSGMGTIVDNEPRITIDDPTLDEGDTGTKVMTFTASLSAAYDQTVTVHYATASDYAVSGKDFTAASGTLTFAPGQTSKSITVAIKGDVIDEYDESFYVNLSAPSTNALIEYGQGYGTIVDNDVEPTIVVSDVSKNEGNSGKTSFNFTLTLSQVSEKYPSVDFYTSDGTTTWVDSDYIEFYDYVDFGPTQTTRTVTVRVWGDTRSEPSEMFYVNIADAWDVTIADGQGVGIILDDDGPRKAWVGPASGGNWSTASNWSPSGVPGSNDDVQLSGGISVNLAANATVRGLSLRGGASLIVASAGNRVFRTSGLAIDSTSKLNLADNDLIFDYAGDYSPLGEWDGYTSLWGSPYTGITGLIASGRHGGAWNGGGIVSTQSDALTNITTLGIDDASHVLGLTGSQTASFSGQTVDATTILIKYTYGGDANLDDKVDGRDLFVLASNWQGNGKSFCTADFNYDGKVDSGDLGQLSMNWQKTMLPPPASSPISTTRLAPKRTAMRLLEICE